MNESINPETHFSSETDEWATPPELLRSLSSGVDGFDLDPCSGAEQKSIATETYTEEDDGLAKPWSGTVWMNPPYSEIAEWMKKAWSESQREGVDCVLALVPARTSTQWWHRFAARGEVVAFIEGRLEFGNAGNSAPFPSAIVVFGDPPQSLYDVLTHWGVAYSSEGRITMTEQTQLD